MKKSIFAVVAVVAIVLLGFAYIGDAQAVYSGMAYAVPSGLVGGSQTAACAAVDTVGFVADPKRSVPFGFTTADLSVDPRVTISVDAASKETKVVDKLYESMDDSDWMITVEILGVSAKNVGIMPSGDSTSTESPMYGLSKVFDCLYATDNGGKMSATRLEFHPFMGHGFSGNDFKPMQTSMIYVRPVLVLPDSVINAGNPVSLRYKEGKWELGMWTGTCMSPVSVCRDKYIESQFF